MLELHVSQGLLVMEHAWVENSGSSSITLLHNRPLCQRLHGPRWQSLARRKVRERRKADLQHGLRWGTKHLTENYILWCNIYVILYIVLSETHYPVEVDVSVYHHKRTLQYLRLAEVTQASPEVRPRAKWDFYDFIL